MPVNPHVALPHIGLGDRLLKGIAQSLRVVPARGIGTRGHGMEAGMFHVLLAAMHAAQNTVKNVLAFAHALVVVKRLMAEARHLHVQGADALACARQFGLKSNTPLGIVVLYFIQLHRRSHGTVSQTRIHLLQSRILLL